MNDEVLKQVQGEPVAFKCGDAIVHIKPPIYGNTTPQTKEWVGLTDEEIENCFDESCHLKVVDPKGGIKGSVNIFEVGRAIVQLCKERNT